MNKDSFSLYNSIYYIIQWKRDINHIIATYKSYRSICLKSFTWNGNHNYVFNYSRHCIHK